MRAAVTDSTGLVVNSILVEDATFNPGPGLTLHILPEDSPVSKDWRKSGSDWVAPPRREFQGDGQTIPGDGSTAATVLYLDTYDDAPGSVVFTVNGTASSPVDLVNGEATLEIVSSTPGDVVQVTVDALPGKTVTIYVEEA